MIKDSESHVIMHEMRIVNIRMSVGEHISNVILIRDHMAERINDIIFGYFCVTSFWTRGDVVILYTSVRQLR